MGVGVSVQTQKNTAITNIMNNSQQNCSVKSVSVASGNVTVIIGSTISGGVTGVKSKSSSTADCNMASTLGAQASSALTNAADADQSTTGTSWLAQPHAAFSVQTSTNLAVSNLSNNIEQSCSTKSDNVDSDNFLFISSSTIGGGVTGVDQESTSQASCSMSASANATSNISQDNQSKVSQKSIGMAIFFIIGAAICVVAVCGLGMRSASKKPVPPADGTDVDGAGVGAKIASTKSKIGEVKGLMNMAAMAA